MLFYKIYMVNQGYIIFLTLYEEFRKSDKYSNISHLFDLFNILDIEGIFSSRVKLSELLKPIDFILCFRNILCFS